MNVVAEMASIDPAEIAGVQNTFVDLVAGFKQIREFPSSLSEAELLEEVAKVDDSLRRQLPVTAPTELNVRARLHFTATNWQELFTLVERVFTGRGGLQNMGRPQLERLSLGFLWLFLLLKEWDERRLSGSFDVKAH